MMCESSPVDFRVGDFEEAHVEVVDLPKVGIGH